MQSAFESNPHIGIIMDGNGRWAEARGLRRSSGHEAGVRAIRPIVEAAADAGVGTMTLYAFSSDNWKRPRKEVDFLMRLLRRYLDEEIETLSRKGIRVSLIGRRDRLPDGTASQISRAEAKTVTGARLHLRIAFDYSARDAIVSAARRASPAIDREAFSASISGDGAGDVDLLIRTGGEQRLSDFLLWECAYAELLFVPTMWPDFEPSHLSAALAELTKRQRRFGGLASDAAAA
ncbi:MAG: di-trans,poly-cis-decaprenylcistransferase [Pseudomonadota bacterium]|nr:di-trans,poly-cis-decaprenylcistransferase [Pseudomonadota bacterium]